jgi:hypothetical protein
LAWVLPKEGIVTLEHRLLFVAALVAGFAAIAFAEEAEIAPTPESCLAAPESFTGLSESCVMPNCCTDGCGWTVTADAIFLQRTSSGSQHLLTDPIPDTEMFNSSALHFSTAAGPRLSLRRQGVLDGELEAVYFGIDGFSASADFPNSALPSGVAGLTIDDAIVMPVYSVQFQYGSRLYNTELNYRRPVNERLTLLSGFRWVELEDRYQATGTENVFMGPFASTVSGQNDLYGFQMGGDLQLLDPGRRLQINAGGKAGIYGNNARASNTYVDTIRDFSASASAGRVAFVGEIGLTASYRLTDHLAARAGYQLLWIDGVTVGANQIASTDFVTGSATVNAAQTVFYHGATAGLELSW